MNISFNQRVALVTGASRGIGRAIALHLAQLGAMVIGTGTSADSVSSLEKSFVSHRLQGRGVILDVNDILESNKIIENIMKERGRIDILINNAGITKDNLAIRMKSDAWTDVLNTNLSAVFRLSQVILKGMLQVKYGRIVNISSVVAHTGNVGQANYASAKAGLEAMSRVLAAEVASRNVTVNCVAPGFIETDMTKKLPIDKQQHICERIPAKRMGTVDDVAHAVCFLASEQAGYINGAVLHVNGGLYMG